MKELKSKLYTLTALSGGEKLQGGVLMNETLTEKIQKIEEIEKEIKTLLERQLQIYDEVEQIEEVNLKVMLRYRYILGWTWESTAEKIGYTVMGLYKLQKRYRKKYKKVYASLL